MGGRDVTSTGVPALDGPLALDDTGVIAELGEILRAAGFTGDRVKQALGASGPIVAGTADRVVNARKLAGLGPLGTLVRLFVFDLPVTAEAVLEAVAPLSLECLAGLGLVERRENEVRPLVRIVPHDEILMASDSRLLDGQPAAADHVAGVHAPSLTLSHLTVRRPVETALDVGTGSGIQSILMSRHSERVVAVDLNRRALGFALFNAWLNGATNVEVRHGSYFEPVAGSRYDLVVSNPPYVISPESEYLFRDSGLPGDSVSRQVVREAAAALAEGGFATILVSWAHDPAENWATPLYGWIEDSGCDAWLLHYASVDPVAHTASWNRELAEIDEDAFAETLERWLAYMNELGIEAVGTGAVILRKRSGGSNWVREDDMPQDRLGPASDHILRIFAAQDHLESLAAERDLLGDRLALAERTRLEQSVVFRDGEWAVDQITLTLEEGLGFRVAIDRDTARLLAGLDGRRTLGEALDELARSAGAVGVVSDQIAAGAVSVMRSLYETGFLVAN